VPPADRGFKIVESSFEYPVLDDRCIVELRNSTMLPTIEYGQF